MEVTTTISPGPRSTEQDGLAEAIESHPIWTELRGPVRQIPNLRGPYDGSLDELLQRDFTNLSEYTNTPESSINDLQNLIGETFPDEC